MENGFDHATGASPEDVHNHATQSTVNNLPEPATQAGHLIASSIKVLIWPTLLAGLFQISAGYNENTALLSLLAEIALIIAVVIHIRRKKIDVQTGMVLGGVAGGIATLIGAIYNLVVFFDIVYIFSTITDPLISGVFMALATGFFTLVLRMKDQNKSKGGDSNGRIKKTNK